MYLIYIHVVEYETNSIYVLLLLVFIIKVLYFTVSFHRVSYLIQLFRHMIMFYFLACIQALQGPSPQQARVRH